MGSSPLQEIDENYDVIVVGGGIVGAGVFRDLAINGVKPLLVEKNDFSSQTSRSSSKMLHGGIRYLENFDFQLVWEALHEKNLWLKIAPHLAHEERFYLPVFEESKRPLWMIRVGLVLYDLLSSLKNTPHAVANAEATKKALPGIRERGLKGSGIYSDAIVDDLKLTLEIIFDGLQNPTARALNHVRVEKFNEVGKTAEVHLVDELTGDRKTVWADSVVFATGPFTDKLLPELGVPWRPKLLPSRGSHLWIKRKSLPVHSPLVITTKDDRVIFVIPQGKRVLVGTTEEKIENGLSDIRPSEKEIRYLVDNIKIYFPEFQEEDAIIEAFAGIRPLVADEDSHDPGKTSREHKIFRPYQNVYVVLGGKYTTFRVMAQDVARELTLKQGLTYQSHRSLAPLRQRSVISSNQEGLTLEKIQEMAPLIVERELVRTAEDFVSRCVPWEDENHLREKALEWFSSRENHQR